MNNKLRTNRSRRGVTLLFTISMIVLFLLMGTTFVVVANDYFKTANRRSRLNTYRIDATTLLDRAFYDVFRGPDLDDINASLRTQSILEDQYGYGHKTTVDSVATVGAVDGLQVLTITNPLVEIHDPSTTFDLVANHPAGFFGGCVLTFTTGEAAGYSSRIVSSFFDGGPLQIVIPTDSSGIDWSLVGADQIIINGRDFSGEGAGNIVGSAAVPYDTLVGGPKIGDGILTPNRKGQSRATMISGGGGGILPYIPLRASVNEAYDVADENNWFLAGEDAAGNIIPSFHRDRHYNFCLTNIGRSLNDIRSFSFRPIYLDDEISSSAQISDSGPGTSRFGEFQEQNDMSGAAAFLAGDLVNGINDTDGLDIDSDGDGTEDAVWIDIGLPVQTDDQGRQFKPLVAYYIVDMDNRLNLNAHGSYADNELGAVARRGGSYGVAEVSLSGATTDYVGLLHDRSGGDNVAGNLDNSINESQTLFGYVNFDFNTGSLSGGGLFASGADVFGKNVVGRDATIYGEDALQGFTTISALTGSSQTIPYAANLGLGGGVGDSLFQAFEMEALLREDDVTSSLQFSRLRDLAGLSGNKDEITTDSAEIAMPPVSYLSLLWGVTGSSRPIYRELVSRGYVSEEMLMGGLYDLNQPTGNGVDDDGDGTVDEPTELSSTVQQSAQFGNPTFDLNNAGDGMAGDNLARQRKANQLYTLALLVTGDVAPPAFATNFTSPEAYRRAVAQWAVNIVDFIDSDSIMTAFEYDSDPFNTVYVDGDPTTDDTATEGFIVFGAERPELIINETFSSHDRRNQDTSSDNGDNDDIASGNDNDWDSTHFPVSNVLIELTNPWLQLDAVNAPRLGAMAADANQVLPAELYSTQARGGDTYYGVDLARLASDGTPVWRIGVKRDKTDTTFVRAIFMADPSGANTDALIVGDNFFPAYEDAGGAGVTPNVVEPGAYHVVGSSGNVNTPNEFRMTFGRLTSSLPDVPNTRSIGLDNTTGANVLSLRDPTGSLDGTNVNCGIAVIDQFLVSDGTTITTPGTARSLSLSDPNGGYEPLIAGLPLPFMVTDEPDGRLFTPAIDTPLDAQVSSGRTTTDLDMIWNNGVNDSFRVIYLQRLADPTQPFNSLHNPYITIDTSEVDLLAYNGLNNDANNDETMESGNTRVVTSTTRTALVSSERGENRANLAAAQTANGLNTARRTYFRTADVADAGMFVNANTGAKSGTDNHNFSFTFDDSGTSLISFGARNSSIGGGLPYSTPTPGEPLGDLVWLNRPLANSMELAHVPIVPNGGVGAEDMPTLLDYFNRCRSIDDTPALTASSTAQEVFAYYFGDDKFGHLMGFGGMAPVPGGAGAMNGGRFAATPVRIASDDANFQANRFDIIFDFVHVPSRFQGLRRWLDAGETATLTATPMATVGGMFFNLRAPFNSLPSFREPGKINMNSLTQSDVFDALIGEFTSTTGTYADLRTERNTTTSLSEFGGRFLPGSRARFVHETTRTNAEAGLFRRNPTMLEERLFDFESASAANDTDTSSWYENEFRQRLGSIATTRSSVFSIWITVGYFEVDQFGRIGRELGSDEGQVQRNRAFYMVDRSIPVASEPGKNHNVDQAVLVRTIIE